MAQSRTLPLIGASLAALGSTCLPCWLSGALEGKQKGCFTSPSEQSIPFRPLLSSVKLWALVWRSEEHHQAVWSKAVQWRHTRKPVHGLMSQLPSMGQCSCKATLETAKLRGGDCLGGKAVSRLSSPCRALSSLSSSARLHTVRLEAPQEREVVSCPCALQGCRSSTCLCTFLPGPGV